jgi:predicted AAA+ superfamily ATPase
MPLLPRERLERQVRRLLRESPVVALLGPRQTGKTTLARTVLAGRRGELFDLEDTRDAQRLAEPFTALEGCRGLVVIDEVQRMPGLLPVLRVLADRRPLKARFLLLGSASFDLLRESSETLAGRIRFVELGGFSLDEVGAASWRRLLVRGGFPRSYLARSDAESLGWREDFLRTFVERDLTSLGIEVRSRPQLRRLWGMLAHRHAQLWNGAELAGALGESYPTVRRHLDLLTGALVVRQLQPWLENAEKRLVRSPKVYVRDPGLVHALLGIGNLRELERHPKLGASFEGLVLEELVRRVGERFVFFWATHGGAELDLLVNRGTTRLGFEVKWGDAPRPTRSMHVALEDLRLQRLYVVYPGTVRYRMHDRIEALPIMELGEVVGS